MRWNERQVLSEAWTEAAVTRELPFQLLVQASIAYFGITCVFSSIHNRFLNKPTEPYIPQSFGHRDQTNASPARAPLTQSQLSSWDSPTNVNLTSPTRFLS